MTHQTFDYVHAIRNQGHRMTTQRQLIMDAICEGRGHVTFEQIRARVREKAPMVSLPTLYRTLQFLRAVRLVASLNIGNKTYYEIVSTKPHHHLICRRCGHIEQVGPELVKPLFITMDRERRFQLDTDHLALFGLCKRCRSSGTATHSHGTP